MVYYLTLYPCACIGIVGTLQTTRRSASAKEQLHHPRGKHGREGGRRPRTSGTTARSKRYYRLQVVLPLTSGTTAPERAVLPRPPAVLPRHYRSTRQVLVFARSESGTTAHLSGTTTASGTTALRPVLPPCLRAESGPRAHVS